LIPAREEKFTLLRFGGATALRVRFTAQSRHVRGSLAAGLGLAYRQLVMKREAVTTGPDPLQHKHVPDPVSYLAPAVTLEAAVHLRIAQTTAISFGSLFWAESAGNDAAFAGDPQSVMVRGQPNPATAPISTPEYRLATNAQITFGLFLGMQFGP
jgi:hypothetical protein